MERVNKTKVLLGGAIKRKNPSKSSEILEKLKVLSDNVLDYGCGYGFDADYFKWDKYDPCYFDNYPNKQFQNIVCINVLNVVSKRIRNEIIKNIQELLNEDGKAYLCVPRNIPIAGKYIVGSSKPYDYLVESIDTFYNQKQLCELMIKNGFSNVEYRNLSNGISAIHSGWKI